MECFLGCPLGVPGGGGLWDASPGGLAILARAALTEEAPQLPRQRERDPLVWDLWHSARWVHVRLALGDSCSALHLVCGYRVYGDDALNRELWTSVAAHLARLGNAPLVLRADFNFPLGDPGGGARASTGGTADAPACGLGLGVQQLTRGLYVPFFPDGGECRYSH